MSTKNDLYEEAILDAIKVKESAVKDAQRTVLEAITPRIREFIEQEILFDNGVDTNESEEEVVAIEPNAQVDAVAQMPLDTIDTPVQPVVQTVVEPSLDKSVLPLMNAIKANDALGAADAIITIIKNTNAIKNVMPALKETKAFQNRVSNVLSSLDNIYQYVQENVSDPALKTRLNERLEENFKDLKQFHEDMMKTNKKNLREAEEALDLGVEEKEDGAVAKKRVSLNIDVPADVADEIVDSLGDIEISVDDEAGDEEDVEIDLNGETEETAPEGEKEDELDLDGAGEKGEEELQLNSVDMSDDTVVEIDEGMLRRELARMRLQETNVLPKVGSTIGELTDDIIDDFGGGCDEGDPLDVKVTTETTSTRADNGSTLSEDDKEKEDMLLDKKDDEKCEGATCESIKRSIAKERKIQSEAKTRGAQLKEIGIAARTAKDVRKYNAAKTQYIAEAKKYTDSVKREEQLKVNLTEATSRSTRSNNDASANDLRRKLAESNLDNVKLQYANKLLQAKSLTNEAKYAIVEQLENATTVKEAKLIVENGVKLLAKKQPSTIVENSGSASRVTRSAGASSVLNEGVEVERWQRLAGIK